MHPEDGHARSPEASRACSDPAAASNDTPAQRQARVFGGSPPTLDLGSVRLRPPSAKDQASIEAAHADPEIMRWYGAAEDAAARWTSGREAVFAITDPDDSWVGTVDLRVDPGDPAAGEVGFLVAPGARGRGYATAALRGVVRWGIAELGLARVQWRAEVGNDASRRVAEKAGFTMEGLLRQSLRRAGRRYDCWVGSILSTDEAGAA